ncbi:hypothetical protein WJX81_008549 [Elliptochloris bilobata]|uniref:Uncharacterized protein n=1 Tax=Elliptochloris bilobata TaxID=381761 RepID=A0AAW1R3B7_9CHLO
MHDGTCIVLDNGGANCKIGLAGQRQPLLVFPNATGKAKGERTVYVGDQLLEDRDLSSLALRRPLERGYLVNEEVERAVWGRAFKAVLPRGAPASDCGLLLTEPLLNLPAIQDSTAQMVFEDFGFASLLATPAPPLALAAWAAEAPAPACALNRAAAGLVVDAGFSFMHAAPVLGGRVLGGGVRRVNLGGKALTNYLKELVSYRSVNMMEETALVDAIKEAACFVSGDMAADLTAARAGGHRLEYVLPNGVTNLRGYVRQPGAPAPASAADTPEQVLVLGNERFMVPELAFRPSDIGVAQGGIAQAAAEAAAAVHPDLRPAMLANVIVVGGLARCPGFVARLQAELRPLVPDECEVAVHMPADPMLAAWQGGSQLAASPEYARRAVTRAEYEERGACFLAA